MPEPGETRIPAGKAISRHTLRLSNVHLGIAHPYLSFNLMPWSLIRWTRRFLLLPSTNVSSSSIAPPAATATSDPTITDAIVALFAHMDVIHKDLVKRIEQVHE